jgi:hypothetical protein
MVMTSAHENHLFLGSVFLVLLIARRYSLLLKTAVHVLLLLQFANLYGLYGEHPESIARFLRSYYSSQMATTYSVIATACFVTIVVSYARALNKTDSRVPRDEGALSTLTSR